MSRLIEQLKEDHVELSDMFIELTRVSVTSGQGQEKLAKAKAKLIAHLKREDSEFYPPLWEMLEDNHQMMMKLKPFADEMKSISKKILGYFDKYEDGNVGPDIQTDFIEVYVVLSKRISAEESFLFPEYERLL